MVTNQGAGGGFGRWYDTIYMSSNAVLSATDQPLGYVYQDHNVGAGGSYAWTNTITIPQVVGGLYHLFVVVDDPSYGYPISESSKANNTNSVSVTIQVPDLAPAVLSLPAFVSVGQAVPVVGVVSNQGNGGGLGYWYDGIYLSTNTVLSASDQPLSYVGQAHSVTAGGSYAWTNTITIPQVVGGSYHLFVVADDPYYGNQISESSKANNTNSVLFTVQVPDLAPAVPGLPALVSVGQSVAVVGVVTNQGNGSGLGGWYDGIYLSTNTVLNATDQPLSYVYQNHGVAAAGNYGWTNTITIPQVVGGSYRLFVVADDPRYGYQISESSKTNNTNSVAVTLQVPDLAPASITVPAAVSVGQAVPVACVVTNQGNGSISGGWYDGIYLSTNAVLNANDQPLSYVYQNHNVAASGKYTWTNTIIIPQVGAGPYYLFVVADDPYYGNQISESSKANNTNAIAVTVQVPDLAPASIVVPAAMSPGQAVAVVCVVTNTGNGSANGYWYDTIYLSSNVVLSAGDRPLTYVYRTHSVTAAGSYAWTNTVTIPEVAGGPYYLFVVADDPYYGLPISEVSKANNTNSVSVTVQVPDLVPALGSVPAVVAVGKVLSVACVVTNQGNGSGLGGWYDTIYLSSNAVLNASDRPSSYVYQNHSVLAGTTYAWTNTFTILQMPAGPYNLFAVADDPYYGFQISESSKSNNTTAPVVLSVVPNSPGLAIAARAAPNPVYTLSELTYSIAVINRGPLPAAGVVVTDSLPASVSFVSAQPSPAVLSDGVLSWNMGSLSNGVSASETVIVRPNLEGALSNVVSVSASSASPSTNTTDSVVTTVIANPSGPRLELTLSGTNIVLSWPTNATGFSLQSTTNFSVTSLWSVVSNTVVVGENYFVTNTIGGDRRFYRLLK